MMMRLFALLLTYQLMAAPTVAVTTLAFHSLIVNLMKEVSEPLFLGSTIDLKESIEVSKIDLLFMDPVDQEALSFYAPLFKGKFYSLAEYPGLDQPTLTPQNASAVVTITAHLLGQHDPDNKQYYDYNRDVLLQRLAQTQGTGTLSETQDLLDVVPEERYFTMLQRAAPGGQQTRLP